MSENHSTPALSFPPVGSEQSTDIRKEVFKQLIDQDMFLVSGSMVRLAKEVSSRYGRKISRQMVSMALTGYRSGESSRSLLLAIKQYLDEQKMTVRRLAGDDIHMQNPHVNNNMGASSANCKNAPRILYETIHRNKDRSLKLIAEEIGVSQSYLTRAALPDQDEEEGVLGVDFPLNKLVPLIKATNDYSVLDSLEASVGRVAVAMPKGESSLHDVCRLAMQSVKKFGDLMGIVGQGMANEGLLPDEKKKIKKEGYEALAAITALLMAIEQSQKTEG